MTTGHSLEIQQHRIRLHELALSQCTAATTPAPGARIGSSIFIASSTMRMSPFLTRVPVVTVMLPTRAGIGATIAVTFRRAGQLSSQPHSPSALSTLNSPRKS